MKPIFYALVNFPQMNEGLTKEWERVGYSSSKAKSWHLNWNPINQLTRIMGCGNTGLDRVSQKKGNFINFRLWTVQNNPKRSRTFKGGPKFSIWSKINPTPKPLHWSIVVKTVQNDLTAPNVSKVLFLTPGNCVYTQMSEPIQTKML